MVVIYFDVTNYLKILWFPTLHLYYLMVSVGHHWGATQLHASGWTFLTAWLGL